MFYARQHSGECGGICLASRVPILELFHVYTFPGPFFDVSSFTRFRSSKRKRKSLWVKKPLDELEKLYDPVWLAEKVVKVQQGEKHPQDCVFVLVIQDTSPRQKFIHHSLVAWP